MAVLAVGKYDIRPGREQAAMEWAKTALPVLLGIPGFVEWRSYRPIVGSSQTVSIYEFADLVAFANWRSHPEVERIHAELHQYFENVSAELWGPSPSAPAPLRPE